MPSTVQIESELPIALRVTGNHYAETRDLNMKEVVLFIERDLFCYLKNLTILETRHSVMLLKHDERFQVCVAVHSSQTNASQALHDRIENLLWAYNQQVFIPKKGILQACHPRFSFQIDVTSDEGGAYAQHSA
jgi:hypothetical protein